MLWIVGVARVPATAEAELEDRQVQRAAFEQPQRGERAVLEVGQRNVVAPVAVPACADARGLDRLERGHQRSIVGIMAIDAHPLVVGQQVRRGVGDRKSTRLNSSHYCASRMPSSA